MRKGAISANYRERGEKGGSAASDHTKTKKGPKEKKKTTD